MARPKGSKNKPKTKPKDNDLEHNTMPENMELKEDLPCIPAKPFGLKTHTIVTLVPDRFPFNRNIDEYGMRDYHAEIERLGIRPKRVTRITDYVPNAKGMYETKFIIEF